MLPINQPSATLRALDLTQAGGRALALDVVLDRARARRGGDIARLARSFCHMLAATVVAVLGTPVGAQQYRPFLR